MNASRIDISEELEAAANGECLVCRIGGTHQVNDACFHTADRALWNYETCSCGWQYTKKWFSACPICNDVKDVLI